MPGPGDVNVVNVITLVAFAVLVLTVATFSRAITYDLIGLPIRAWVEEKFTKASKWNKLVNCWWCLSFWISLIVCMPALTLAAMAYGHPWWWGSITALFVFPAVRYAAAWVIDRTVD